jgi:hypothetical protein
MFSRKRCQITPPCKATGCPYLPIPSNAKKAKIAKNAKALRPELLYKIVMISLVVSKQRTAGKGFNRQGAEYAKIKRGCRRLAKKLGLIIFPLGALGILAVGFKKMRGQTGQTGQTGQIGQAAIRNSGKQRSWIPVFTVMTTVDRRGQIGQNGQRGQTGLNTDGFPDFCKLGPFFPRTEIASAIPLNTVETVQTQSSKHQSFGPGIARTPFLAPIMLILSFHSGSFLHDKLKCRFQQVVCNLGGVIL